MSAPVTTDLERAIVGALLVRPKRVLEVDLDARWFGSETCRQVYLAVTELVLREGTDTLDLELVRTQVAQQGHALTLPALYALAEEDGIDLRGLSRALRDRFRRRMAMALAESLLVALRDEAVDVREAVLDRVEHLHALFAGGERHLHGYLETIGQRIDAALSDTAAADRVPTGFPALDDVLGEGLPRGGLTIVGARPGRGKSSFLQQVVEHAMARGRHALLCTPEMSALEVGDRAASRLTGVGLRPLTARRMSTLDRHALRHSHRLTEVATWGAGALYDDPAQTTKHVAQIARRLSAGTPLDVVAVDYIQFLADKREAKAEPRYEVIGRSARRLKAVARTTGAAVVVGAQLRRDAENREPTLADLRESGDLEQDADVVLLLCDADAAGFVKVLVEKHRQGPVGCCELRWIPERTEFDRGTA